MSVRNGIVCALQNAKRFPAAHQELGGQQLSNTEGEEKKFF